VRKAGSDIGLAISFSRPSAKGQSNKAAVAPLIAGEGRTVIESSPLNTPVDRVRVLQHRAANALAGSETE
jgi:hypothetical protein